MSIITAGDIPINENQVDGTELARRLERLYAAFHSQNANPIRPPYATAGAIWSKTVAGGFDVMLYDGAIDIKINSVINGSMQIPAGTLTTGQIPVASSTGTMGGSSDLTYSNGALNVNGGVIASGDSSFTSTGAILISKGTTSQQPTTPSTGMMRYNSTTNQFEGYSGTTPSWKSIGGSALNNDITTATNLYPLFSAATTGTAENIYTSDAKYLYKPSTGELRAETMTAGNAFFTSSHNIAESHTVGTGQSAMTIGPSIVAAGETVTVSAGSRWVVL